MKAEVSRKNLRPVKASRAESDYGLPRLTVEEAARVLGLAPSAFMDWLAVEVKPTLSQWANWRAGTLPESLIRLYLNKAALKERKR